MDEFHAWEVLHQIAHRTISAGQVEGRLVVKPENALPPGLDGFPTGFGWQEHEGNIVNICKEPKMLRECLQPQCNLISTWVRDQDGWTTLEAAVTYTTNSRVASPGSTTAGRRLFINQISHGFPALPHEPQKIELSACVFQSHLVSRESADGSWIIFRER